MLRRSTDRGSLPCMAAAEVLEMRALLSAGAAAVHQATVHAVHPGELTPNTTLHPVVVPQVTVQNSVFTGPKATSFSISQPSLTAGSAVKMQAAFTVLINNAPISFKATFSGKVLSSGPFLGGTEILVTPTGGSLVGHGIVNGKKSTVHLAIEGKVAAVFLDSHGNFAAVGVPYSTIVNNTIAEFDVLLKT